MHSQHPICCITCPWAFLCFVEQHSITIATTSCLTAINVWTFVRVVPPSGSCLHSPFTFRDAMFTKFDVLTISFCAKLWLSIRTSITMNSGIASGILLREVYYMFLGLQSCLQRGNFDLFVKPKVISHTKIMLSRQLI